MTEARSRLDDPHVRRLLRDAGVPTGFAFKLHNRADEQALKAVGIWAIDRWRQIGLNVKHRVEPAVPCYFCPLEARSS